MPEFTNYATLSYSGGILNSNTVTGQISGGSVAFTKTAVMDDYTAKDDVTYVLTLVNSGETDMTGLTITDDLGGYDFDGTTLYPLAYTEGSLLYYLNGVLQPAPTVTAGPPLVISGINVPAGGNAILIYEATVTNFAPLDVDGSITNTALVKSEECRAPMEASETIETEDRADLTISKTLCPETVEDGDCLTYTFVIQNTGNTAATAEDEVVLTDTFDPILTDITVTYDGTVWTEGTEYTYDKTTGAFATVSGAITVPAATFAQNEDGAWIVTPGTAVLVITGTV